MSKKIGIIGAGGMLEYHAAGFCAGGADLLAICDMNEKAAQKAAKELGIPHVFSDSAKMLSELTDLDAISIITPNRTHRPLAIQALEAGKHVFCEKPPALNAPEVNEMKQAIHRGWRGGSDQFGASQVDSQDRHSRLWRLVYKQGNVWRRSTYRSFAYG